MKNTKKVLLAMFLFALSLSFIQAQNEQGKQTDPEKRADRHTQMMAKKLSLDEKQMEEVKAINLKYAAQHKQMRERAKSEREAMRQERKQVQEQKNDEFKKVLTAEQFALLEKEQGERMKQPKEGRQRGSHHGRRMGQNIDPEKRAGHMTTRMVDELDLDEKQAEKLRQANHDFLKEMETFRSENKAEREAKKEAGKKLKDEHQAKIKEILTPEQFAEWENLKEERGPRGKHRKGGPRDGRM